MNEVEEVSGHIVVETGDHFRVVDVPRPRMHSTNVGFMDRIEIPITVVRTSLVNSRGCYKVNLNVVPVVDKRFTSLVQPPSTKFNCDVIAEK